MRKFDELSDVERRLIEKWYKVKDLADRYPDPEVRTILMEFLVALDDWFAKFRKDLKDIKSLVIRP